MNNLMAFYGSAFGTKRVESYPACITDIAPTILTLFDKPIGEKMTGRFLKEVTALTENHDISPESIQHINKFENQKHVLNTVRFKETQYFSHGQIES